MPVRSVQRRCTVSSTSKPASGAPPSGSAANDIESRPQKPETNPRRAGAVSPTSLSVVLWPPSACCLLSYKQKQARNRRQSTQHRATECAKISLRLRFSESPSNTAAIKTKNQLNRSEGTQVMDFKDSAGNDFAVRAAVARAHDTAPVWRLACAIGHGRRARHPDSGSRATSRSRTHQ